MDLRHWLTSLILLTYFTHFHQYRSFPAHAHITGTTYYVMHRIFNTKRQYHSSSSTLDSGARKILRLVDFYTIDFRGSGKASQRGLLNPPPRQLKKWGWGQKVRMAQTSDRCQSNGNDHLSNNQHDFRGWGGIKRTMLHYKTWFYDLDPLYCGKNGFRAPNWFIREIIDNLV